MRVEQQKPERNPFTKLWVARLQVLHADGRVALSDAVVSPDRGTAAAKQRKRADRLAHAAGIVEGVAL